MASQPLQPGQPWQPAAYPQPGQQLVPAPNGQLEQIPAWVASRVGELERDRERLAALVEQRSGMPWQLEEAVQKRQRELWQDREARRRLAADQFTEPPGSLTLAELLASPPADEQYRIAHLLGWRHNLVIAGERKAGKTSLLLDAARALADGGAFLGCPVTAAGAVGYWNYEMVPADLARYARPLGIRGTGSVHVANLRGNRVPFLASAAARDWTVKWLAERGVKVWVLDPWRVMCAQNGVRPNLDEDVGQLTDAIDQIKAEAGVESAIIPVHMPHQTGERELERFKGAGGLGDWADALWTLAKDKTGQRYLWAFGRGIDMPESKVTRDAETLRWSYVGGNREDSRAQQIRSDILGVVASGRMGREAVIARVGGRAADVRREIDALVQAGQLAETRQGTAKMLTLQGGISGLVAS